MNFDESLKAIEAQSSRLLAEQVARGVITQVVATGIHHTMMRIVSEELNKVSEDDQHE
jgi:hypothetical protein